ncbi:ABC transporter related protein [Acidothermus cellulolyticus 11B]|uniref:ABC transporter related protein n=1 Tax=Acidothermus cellulolyticus (strain ATCC 43068 / DSM 8971 / 11B) TaxID=351607 RepID=A0LTF6_ACIC1|nr:ATP-binding cassette domain-containing protein [Acidothermus cellulolyticus]ABK52716.1 ABC transporter related protein [Acidothermus cellulolyticus 11B]
MITFDRVTFRYPETDRPVLDGVTLAIPEGELTLVVGGTGSGKSTLLRAVNGLVPHFTGGHLAGRVIVAGRDTRDHPPRELADIVGYVGQDPAAGFVTDTVEDELAYAMEWLGVPPATMRRRVEDILDLLDLSALRSRRLGDLSGGEQQRVAIGAVLTAGPRILVLDEPTSALDPPAAEEVLAVLTRLVHDLGMTVLVAEHRLERIVQYADRILLLPGDGRVVAESPAAAMAVSPLAPPVVHLARLAGWHPVPLSIRDARRHAEQLRDRLATLTAAAANGTHRSPAARSEPTAHHDGLGRPTPDPVVDVRRLTAGYDGRPALRDVTIQVDAGEIVAVMGRNGAGKTTLLAHIAGLAVPWRGDVRVCGAAPHRLSAGGLVRCVGFVPHEPSDLFYADTVAGELADLPDGLSTLQTIAPDIEPHRHPRDLSEGEQLAVALAVVLSRRPRVLALDEPTRGLDYTAKARLAALLRTLARSGTAILLATHDVELAAEVATRTVVLAEGEVVADGPTASVVTATPAFAPQVARILHPLPWLTVADVAAALAGSR